MLHPNTSLKHIELIGIWDTDGSVMIGYNHSFNEMGELSCTVLCHIKEDGTTVHCVGEHYEKQENGYVALVEEYEPINLNNAITLMIYKEN